MNQKDKPQSEKFKEKARELGVDETGAEFERALERIVPPKSGTKEAPVNRSKGSVDNERR